MSWLSGTTTLFLAGAFVTGALVPFQLAFNAQLGSITKNPFTAGLLIFLIGAVVLAALAAIQRAPIPSAEALRSAPVSVWLGGVIAAFYILAIVIVTPNLGVGVTAIMVIAGQILMALILDYLGAFGNVQISLNGWRLAGAALVVGGVVLIKAH